MSGAPDLSPIRPRLLTSWALAHGLPRLALSAAARRGGPVAGTAIDPHIREDPFATYDRIREQGPIVHGKLMSATATHAAANEVLQRGLQRGPRFRPDAADPDLRARGRPVGARAGRSAVAAGRRSAPVHPAASAGV